MNYTKACVTLQRVHHCPNCKKVYQWAQDLKWHTRDNHEWQQKCPFCCARWSFVMIPTCYIFLFALLYADTSDCFPSSIPHPLIGLLYFYDPIWLTRSYLVASCLVRYSSGVVIRSLMYDTHLRATDTTTSSIRGVQIPIYLVSNTTDSLQRSVAVLKLYQ